MAEQNYELDGPTDFFFPYPVRTAGQIIVSVVPGGVLPQSSYQIIGASSTATGVTIRWLDAPRDGSATLNIQRRTSPLRVSDFLSDLSITATALNGEFNNILQIVQDGVVNEFRGAWVTDRLYLVLDVIVGPDDNIYVAQEQHTSGVFATDLTAEKWLLAADFSTGQTNIDAALAAAVIARNKAEDWADEAEDVPVEAGQFSAKHHAIKSAASAGASSTSATNSENSAIAADISETNALASEVAAALSFDNFDVRYLGAKTADPTLDNSGGALIAGALYFNSTVPEMRVYNGTAWEPAAAIDKATTAQAEAGTDDAAYMTSLKTVQSITENAPSPASQTQAVWDTGTDTTESLISPAKLTDKILSDFNATGSAPLYACRAWVNFNGKGTVAIRASGNVSSITDNGVGMYTVNFTTAMPDANYSAVAWGTFVQASRCGLDGSNITASNFRFRTAGSSGSADPEHVFASVYR